MFPRSPFPLAPLLLAIAPPPAADAYTTGSPTCRADAAILQAQHGGSVPAPGGDFERLRTARGTAATRVGVMDGGR